MKSFLKKAGCWTCLLIFTNLLFLFMAWLLNPKAIKRVSGFLLLFTVLILCAGYYLEYTRCRKARRALQAFLDNPCGAEKQQLISALNDSWTPVINALYYQIRKQSEAINLKEVDLQNYREYIEAWTHEIKTPLSLATLVLENHKEEMSSYVYRRFGHVRQKISEDVERILYYARLQADHVDYRFERGSLDTYVKEWTVDFAAIAEEQNTSVRLEVQPLEVVSDFKVLSFLFAQLLSNAIKYADAKSGVVCVKIWKDEEETGKTHLAVRDNGAGVPPEDAPFIFDKGFTGSHPNRQKATGMGLYLVKKYAEILCVEVKLETSVSPEYGFGIEMIFPYHSI